MAENPQKSKSNFVAPLTKIYREKIKKSKESIQGAQSMAPAGIQGGGSAQVQGQTNGSGKQDGINQIMAASGSNSIPGWPIMGNLQTEQISPKLNGEQEGVIEVVASAVSPFIKKYVNVMRGFKKRYFLLTPELLIYYKEKKGQVSEKGQISLKLAKVDPRTMNDKKMIIGTGMSEVFLEFSTIQEKKEWLVAIDDCKKRLTFTSSMQESLVFTEPEGQVQQDLQRQKYQSSNYTSVPVTTSNAKHVQEELTRSSKMHEEKKQSTKTAQPGIIGLDTEVKQALNAALQANIIKDDSSLSVHLAETWQAQQTLEDSLNQFKFQLSLQEDRLPQDLIKIAGAIDQKSNDLKQTVTNAIKAIEKTKIQIIRILEVQDEMLKKQASNLSSAGASMTVDEKGYLGEDSRFVSFSQEFNDLVEHKRNIRDDILENSPTRPKTQLNKAQVIEQIRQSRLDRPSLFKNIEEAVDEEDDFFDAVGDQETLQHAQQEIFKAQEESKHDNSRSSDAEQDYRTILPALKPPDQKVSVWKVIKDAIGKDITRFCVPVYFNEPLSMLQKVSEIMEYESLLVKASDDPDSLKRLMYVAAFGIAQYKCSDKRLNKPFNPILGETFELKRPNYLFFSEQVSHHPPVSACFSQSDSYEFWMNTSMKTNFWGKSLEIKPFGFQNVKLKTTGERFTIERPSSSVNNLIFGEMYIEHSGTMTVRNIRSSEYVEIEFKKRGWGAKNAYEIEGYAFTAKKEKKWKMTGKWIDQINVKSLTTNEEFTLWQANPMPKNSESMYNFTYFTLQLNYLPPGLQDKLPPTDARLRPDQRALEEGDLIKAASEKARLEDKQRKLRKEREQNGEEHRPIYFEEFVDDETGEKGYKYIRDYWKDRNEQNWAHIPHLF